MLLKQLIYHTFFQLLLLHELLRLNISHLRDWLWLFKLLSSPDNLLMVRILLWYQNRIDLHHGRCVHLLMNYGIGLLRLGKLLVLYPFFETLLNGQSHYVLQGGLNMQCVQTWLDRCKIVTLRLAFLIFGNLVSNFISWSFSQNRLSFDKSCFYFNRFSLI